MGVSQPVGVCEKSYAFAMIFTQGQAMVFFFTRRPEIRRRWRLR